MIITRYLPHKCRIKNQCSLKWKKEQNKMSPLKQCPINGTLFLYNGIIHIVSGMLY